MIIQFGELKEYPEEQALQTVPEEQAEQPAIQGTQKLVKGSLYSEELHGFRQNEKFNIYPFLQPVHTNAEVQAEQLEAQATHLLVTGFL